MWAMPGSRRRFEPDVEAIRVKWTDLFLAELVFYTNILNYFDSRSLLSKEMYPSELGV